MEPTQRLFLRISGVTGALAVVTGAFGAHGLESRLTVEMLDIWQTAVQYHFYHAIPMFALACAPAAIWEKRAAGIASALFFAGILVFSGSLYILALTEIRWLGAITPIGGLAFILGWLTVCFAAVKSR